MTLFPQKPYAESCVRNSQPILEVLARYLEPGSEILEIGSGTGQHAVHFCQAFPGITWQTSDLRETHAGIQLWIEESGLTNLIPPLTLDVAQAQWPTQQYDTIFTANTAHIMAAEAVEKMFRAIPYCLKEGGQFILYGPFKYDGQHTSESNIHFEHWLKSVATHRGIRDVTWLQTIGDELGIKLVDDIEMPANNRILVWQR